MNDVPLHRLFHHYSEMPYSQRVLYTATLLVLGMGYLFALLYVFHTYAGRAGGSPLMLTYHDIVAGYSGTGKGSVIEGALRGPMRNMAPEEEVNRVVAWAQAGASPVAYQSDIAPLIVKRCLICHDGSNPHIPNLSSYDEMKKVTAVDTGTDVFTLVRRSHIHLFGLTFIFYVMGSMFSHAYVRPIWFKCAIVGVPFAAIIGDVSSWYFTKLFHPFGWVVILSGAILAACFAVMWFVTLYQLWFSRTPRPVLERAALNEAGIE